jgi:two-component system C4-dicarboxylate transport response regulator DctD
MIAASVVLVEDDAEVLEAHQQTLELEGLRVIPSSSVDAALAVLSRDMPVVVVSDVRMPDGDGLSLLDAVKALDPEIPVLLVTGHADVPMALRAIRAAPGLHREASRSGSPRRVRPQGLAAPAGHHREP